jgi:sodium/bile acid cotransporter 7
VLSFLRHRWFLLTLIAVLALGTGWPHAMQSVTRRLSGEVILALTTFLMALPLATGELWRAVRKPGPAWLATLINSGFAPPLGWVASLVLSGELAAGMIVATTVPSTLASAAVLTRRAGGKEAIPFLVTMITNLSCFIVVPAWLWLLLSLQANVDFNAIVLKLLLLVVLPIIVAQILRQWRPIGTQAARHKLLLGVLAQIGVLLMVLVGAVDCGLRLAELDSGSVITPANVALLIVAVVAVHAALVAIGLLLCRLLSIGRDDAIGVAFAGGQKTLMVGTFLATAVAPLAILPMVTYHAAQLIIDTMIADWFRQRPVPDEVEPEL